MISSRVCPLIDWYQAVFNDCSIQDVFEAIKVNYLVTDDVEKVFAERFFMSVGYETSLVLILTELYSSFEHTICRCSFMSTV